VLGSDTPLARVRRRAVSAREVARAFLRELLAAVKHSVASASATWWSPHRSTLRDLPCRVQRILDALGVRRVRFVTSRWPRPSATA